MCGRYIIRKRDLLPLGAADRMLPTFEELSEQTRFNVAPSQLNPIVRLDREGARTIACVKWGLIPSWTSGTPKLQPINAMSETAITSPMFRQAIQRRRCLVPSGGFYEWKGAKPPKQPFFIHMKSDEPFAFAGIWERWRESDDTEAIDTYAILTTSPNDLMKQIHNRMPVIIAEKDYDRWLDRNIKAEDVADVMKPHDADSMEAYAVSTQVNSVRNEGQDLISPV